MANETTIWDSSLIKVLLVEDDEDDFIITRDLFSEMRSQRFTLDWMKTFDTGLQAMTLNQHDVCLVDYRLGARNGVDLLRAGHSPYRGRRT
jgi:DNA-binding response OmpR family regulator